MNLTGREDMGDRMDDFPFLPMTAPEMKKKGWSELDVLIVTGDAYVDHPSFGAALIARALEADGWRAGIIAQPDWRTCDPFRIMGRPRLFCGVTSGNQDSMLANYTASRRKRREDAYSEGGITGRRPNHAVVVYAQRVREAWPGLPIILGGIEASLRRTVHYDYWEDRLKPSILLDAKADLMIYGMGEEAAREAARRLSKGAADLRGIRGTAYMMGAKESGTLDSSPYAVLPSWEECMKDKRKMLELAKKVEAEQNPYCARPLVQFHGERALVIEPPTYPPAPRDIDRLYELPFTGKPHPSYEKEIPAHSMVKDSVTAVRGCAGGCSFCSLSLHQGKFLCSRTEQSLIRELTRLAGAAEFRGTVSDLGGPTANMYGCRNDLAPFCRKCRRPGCLFPSVCGHFGLDEERIVSLYRRARRVRGVAHLFISSGIRMDLALSMPSYLRELIRHHVSGHLKVAPEHLHPGVLRRMRKPAGEIFPRFCQAFERESRRAGKEQYIVPYFISSFPGCTEAEMKVVEDFLRRKRWKLQQVQDFIPLPMTAAAAMYYTGLDYETGRPIQVTRGLASRKIQMRQLRWETGGRMKKVKKKSPGRKGKERV